MVEGLVESVSLARADSLIGTTSGISSSQIMAFVEQVESQMDHEYSDQELFGQGIIEPSVAKFDPPSHDERYL